MPTIKVIRRAQIVVEISLIGFFFALVLMLLAVVQPTLRQNFEQEQGFFEERERLIQSK